MADVRPNYYSIIPADVRYDDSIPANAKLLYGEISALIGKEGFCFATNQYFSELYGMADETISRLISKLETAGHIKREMERDATGQIVSRKIFLRVSIPDAQPLDEKINTSPQKNQEGIDEKVKDTVTSITDIKKKQASKTEPLTDDELRPIVADAISQLATPSWSVDIKNELFRWVMALYDPERVVRKAHPVRSRLSVQGTFRKLALSGSDPAVMINMLCSAIEGGWQGVVVPNSGKGSLGTGKPKQEERSYRCV